MRRHRLRLCTSGSACSNRRDAPAQRDSTHRSWKTRSRLARRRSPVRTLLGVAVQRRECLRAAGARATLRLRAGCARCAGNRCAARASGCRRETNSFCLVVDRARDTGRHALADKAVPQTSPAHAGAADATCPVTAHQSAMQCSPQKCRRYSAPSKVTAVLEGTGAPQRSHRIGVSSA
jgi:hypothetical protein